MQRYQNIPQAKPASSDGGSAGCVYVVDDDASVRAALSSLLRSLDLEVRAFPGVDQFRAGADGTAPACLLLDVRMPGTSGLEFQDQLASFAPDLPVIFITGHGDVPMSVRAMKAGAVDFLQKPWSEQAVLDAVFSALARSRAKALASSEREALAKRAATLTPREREVLLLVTRGLANKQIAYELGLQLITVKIHRGNVMRKMQAASLVDLVMQAKTLGLAGVD
ncbi:MAG: two component transcriptional regulator, LuxR family [Xanthobacteraceae bacterium]|nr:two component transcriptional regulator, LuxR family [Xanthobacteraceae bacterium]